MNKYELGMILSLLRIASELLGTHVPAMYGRDAFKEVLRAIDEVQRDIRKLEQNR